MYKLAILYGLGPITVQHGENQFLVAVLPLRPAKFKNALTLC